MKRFVKQFVTAFCAIIFFAAMLAFPGTAFRGACSGLLLWFHTVVPTLLPFLILTNLMLCTGAVDVVSQIIAPVLCRFFRVSPYGAFAILTGFLCGCPMGSKVTADLLKQKAISEQEGRYLLSFCNNTSPMFIVSYVIWQNLQVSELTLPLTCILMAAPILLSFLFRRIYGIPADTSMLLGKRMPVSETRDVSLDDCMMDSFETVTKIGGYIILFSILAAFAEMLPLQSAAVSSFLLPSLEITTGVMTISQSLLPRNLRIIRTLALVSFGGWCAAAQTKAMLRGTSLPFLPYIAEKLTTALVASLLASLFLLL